MASEKFINPDLFFNMSLSQILTWRIKTYGDIKNEHSFTEDEIKNMKRSPSIPIKDIYRSFKNQIAMHMSTGCVPKYSDYVFVIVDCCILCHHDLSYAISDLQKDYNLFDKHIILIASEINLTENMYKMINKKTYKGVRFDILQKNMRLLSGDDKFQMENVIVVKTNIIFDNFILWKHEWTWLKKYGNWYSKGCRQEINDNSQLEILVKLSETCGKMGFMISNDKGLLEKTRCVKNGFIHAKTITSKSYSSSKRKYKYVEGSHQVDDDRWSKVPRRAGRTN